MESRWFIVIPPSGAARFVAQHTSNIFSEKLGKNRVKVFDSLVYEKSFKSMLMKNDENLVIDLINQSMIISCLDFEATHFFSGALSPVSLFSLNLLRKHHVKTIHWFYEDYNRVTYWNAVFPGYDVFLTIQIGPFPEISIQKQRAWHLLPTAASLAPVKTLSDEKRVFDIVFIGIPSAYRIKVLELIVESGFKCAIAGLGWDSYQGSLKQSIISGKWIDENQSALLLSSAKIGLNLSVDDPAGKSDVHLSPRVFDTLMSGALLLTEETPLNREIMVGCSFETFSSPEHVRSAIDSILSNFKEYNDKRLENIQTVKSHHMYRNRVDQIITLVE
jgi:hypothetical protein